MEKTIPSGMYNMGFALAIITTVLAGVALSAYRVLGVNTISDMITFTSLGAAIGGDRGLHQVREGAPMVRDPRVPPQRSSFPLLQGRDAREDGRPTNIDEGEEVPPLPGRRQKAMDMAWDLEFVVYGVAVAQGSVKPFAVVGKAGPMKGKIVSQRLIHGNQAKLMAWRNEVKQAAGRAWENKPLLEGAVETEMVFILPRPQYLRDKPTKRLRPPKPRVHHTKRPDRGKLVRAVEDALTGVVWVDDSQVVHSSSWKVYDYDEPPQVKVKVRALTEPGPSKVSSTQV